MPQTSVALIDDHKIMDIATATIVSRIPDLKYLGISASVEELLANHDRVDLVILDLRLADGSYPVDNVEKLRATGAKILVFTSGENPYLVRLLAQTKVFALVQKTEPVSTLEAALISAARNERIGAADPVAGPVAVFISKKHLDDAKLSNSRPV